MAKLKDTSVAGNLTVTGKVTSTVAGASTTTIGTVKLNSATNSTSTTEAATPSAVKAAYDLANGKANASHGNHIPAAQVANNAVYLRNDNTWQTITPDKIGAAASSHAHDSAYTKRVNLAGQLQKNSFRRSVIALCNANSGTNSSAHSYSIGTISFHRFNGLSGSVKLEVAIEEQYHGANSINVSFSALTPFSRDSVRPCTFIYNGVRYGGVEVFFDNAELPSVEFNGVSNFNIFGLDYYNTQDKVALIAEVNNSIEFTTGVSKIGYLNLNGNSVYHTGNKPTPTDIGAAAASHGNHVPATQTANNAVYLRNDNTWQTITPDKIGAVNAKIEDTRTVNYTPTTCPDKLRTTFQNNGTNGVSDGGGYYSLLHIPRWANTSGGYPHQMAFTDNGRLWLRRATSDTAWDGWAQVYTSKHKPSLSDLGAAPASHTHNYASTAAATTSANGLMTAAMVTKLNGIATGANAYTHPGSGTNPHGTTKSDVGLGSVNNWGASSTISANSTSQYATTNMVAQVRAEKANASHGTHVSYGGNGSASTVSRSDHSHSSLTALSAHMDANYKSIYNVQTICGGASNSNAVNIAINSGNTSAGGRFRWTGSNTPGGPRAELIPATTDDFRVGSVESPIHGLHTKRSVVTTSDGSEKKNIQYIDDSNQAKVYSIAREVEDTVNKEDFYNFFKEEIKFCTYSFKNGDVQNLETNLGFIAQDIAETKVGSKIVIKPIEKKLQYNEETKEEEEVAVEGVKYSYSTGNYTSAIAIALQKSIEKIEELELRVLELETKTI